MTAQQWTSGRQRSGLKQQDAAKLLGVKQGYLSQLESGARVAGSELTRKAAKLYKMPTALPFSDGPVLPRNRSVEDVIQQQLASLEYSGFSHLKGGEPSNPAQVVLEAVSQRDLNTRLVEALPWVLTSYPDLNWDWLRDNAKLRNAQNRLAYVTYLAEQTARMNPEMQQVAAVLAKRRQELEASRLAVESTLCRESMPEAEKKWLRTHRPEVAAHWALLTGLRAEQLPYANAR